MCGRITQYLSKSELAALYRAEALDDLPGARFNVAPTQMVLVIVEDGEKRVVTAHRWGLIPPWADNPQIASRLINARAETVADKPAFRSAFRHHRCLVPVDGFYEWKQEASGKSPYAIVRHDGKPLALAGLWSSWRDAQSGEEIRSFTIITTTANTLMRPIHERMPVILPEDTWDVWLDPEFQDVGALQSFLRPCPEDLLRAYRVSRRVNDVTNDGPELLEAVV